MQLFWGSIANGHMVLQGDEARHCSKVLRKQIGDEILVIDGSGVLFTCRIVGASKSDVFAHVVKSEAHFGEVPYHLNLAIAPTKNIDRFEWLLEKATEMGVTSVTPLLTAHAERKHLREDRLQRILIAAAKQSYKGCIPQLQPLTPFSDYLRSAQFDQKYIAHCFQSPKSPFAAQLKAGKSLTICIGPEGDFSQEEVAQATQAGFVPVSLGTSRLRTETAGMVAVAAVYNFYAAHLAQH